MAKVGCMLLCLAVVISTAYSLNCYSCSTDNTDGCTKHSKPKEVTCPAPADPKGSKNVCLYKHIVDKDTKKIQINATCEQIQASLPVESKSLNKCTNLAPNVELKECNVCASDLCNSANGFSVNYLSLLLAPVMYYISRLVLH